VAEKLLLSLDFKNLLKCRLVNSTWKNFLDMNPTFWIKKCQHFGLRDEICLAWKNLAQKLEQPDLIQDLVLYMMKMLQGAPYSFEYPIHVAIKNTDKALALFIIENKAVYLGKNSSGSNSLQLAAEKGMLDIVVALKSLYDEPNSPNSDGKTPTELAEINGHSGVIGILSPGPSNNHTSSATFLTVRQKIEKSLSKKTREMSTSEGDGDEPMLQKLMTNKKKKIIFKENILSFNERALKDPTAKLSIESESGENEPGPMDED